MMAIPAKIIKIAILTVYIVSGFIMSAAASDQIPAPPQKRPIALLNGDVYTVTKGVIKGGAVLFESGKITVVGKDINLPENTEIIDVSGKRIYPGFIEANTMLGLTEIGRVRATHDYMETGIINPNVRAEAAFNPDSELLPVTRANGITMALSIPEGGLISGTSALMMMDGWTWEEMILKAPVGLHIRWPSMKINKTSGSAKSLEEQLEERDKKIEAIRKAFADARAYLIAKGNESDKDIPYHETDLRWESIIPVLNREIPALVHADGIREIQAAVDWASDENINMILVGGYDAWRVSNLLKQKEIPIIITAIHRLPTRNWEGYDMPFTLPRKLKEAGINFCIAGKGGYFETAHARNLPYQAATAAAYGLPKEDALKSITIYPAQILGIDDQAGSIEVGKDASLIVTNGDPLEIMTNVEMEFIQGRQIDLRSKHTLLYEKYLQKYRQMGIIKE
jgi:imidazolonepropionase-like amidohydrolase